MSLSSIPLSVRATAFTEGRLNMLLIICGILDGDIQRLGRQWSSDAFKLFTSFSHRFNLNRRAPPLSFISYILLMSPSPLLSGSASG
jgi:hypothetical protein